MAARRARIEADGAPFAALAACLALGAACGAAALLRALAPLAAEGGLAPAWAALPAALLLLPWLHRPPAGRRRRTAVGARVRAGFALAVELTLLAFSLAALGIGAGAAGALFLAQGYSLSRARQGGAAVLALLLSVLKASLALSLARDGTSLALLLAALFAAVAASVLLHGMAARAGLLHRRQLAADPPSESGGLGARLRYAAILAALAVPAGLALVALASSLQRIDPKPPPPGAEGARAGPAPQERVWSAGLPLGAPAGPPSDEEVLRMRARLGPAGEPLTDGRPLRLRASCSDTFTDLELRHLGPELELLWDEADGEADGWIRPSGAADPQRWLELEIAQSPLRLEGELGNVLLRGEPLVAVEAPAVRYDPDGPMLTVEPIRSWFGYRVRAEAARPRPAAGEAARHAGSRFLQLPPPSPALERIASRAGSIALGARGDLELVERVVAHFHGGFAYSLEGSSLPGTEGVEEFLERREGYCTSFASAAVLLLRTLGLPARAVLGYLASEWDADQGFYVVRARHAHVWIEVHFERSGWVPFDPTPPASRPAGARAAAQAGVLSWGGRLLGQLGDVALARPGGAELSDLAATAARAPAALSASLRASPAAALSLALAAILFLAVPLARRARGGAARLFAPLRRDPSDLWQLVLRALERRGFQKDPAQTPREFARHVVSRGGEAYAPLAEIAEAHYRARFGGAELERAERERIRAFARTVAGIRAP